MAIGEVRLRRGEEKELLAGTSVKSISLMIVNG